jgi:heptosyltransferase-2
MARWMADVPPGAPVQDLMGSTDVRESAALLSVCAVAVANDSGAMHLAQAAGTPTVALFGSTDPRWTGPAGASTVLRHEVVCSPCFRKVCPYELECWEGIAVADVVTAALSLAAAEPEVV